jgi:DNA-binding NtrC family response regulator
MSAHGLRVLVIDDEKNIRSTLTLCLEQIHCEVTAVASAQAALEALAQQPHDLAFLDLHLGQSNGLELIPQLLGQAPDLMIVIMTAYATVDRAVKAIQSGAADYLPKPFTPAQIRHIVAKASRKKPQRLSAAAEAALVAYGWPGNIRELRNTIERAVILWPAEIIEPEAFPAHICVRSKAHRPEIGGNFSLEESSESISFRCWPEAQRWIGPRRSWASMHRRAGVNARSTKAEPRAVTRGKQGIANEFAQTDQAPLYGILRRFVVPAGYWQKPESAKSSCRAPRTGAVVAT